MTFVPVRVKWSQEQEPITSCEGRWSCLTSSSLPKLYMSAPLGFSFSWKPRTETLPLHSCPQSELRFFGQQQGFRAQASSRITLKRNSFNLVIVGKVIVWDFWGSAARRKSKFHIHKALNPWRWLKRSQLWGRGCLHLRSIYFQSRCPLPGGIVSQAATQILWAPIKSNDISWNFEKILVNHKGNPVKRYLPSTEPFDLIDDIISLLQQC